MIQPDYRNYSIFYNQTQTYDITDISYGFMKDIIETLSQVCNFTYEIHIRKDKKFGTITEFPNGTKVASGMFESLLDDSGKNFLYIKITFSTLTDSMVLFSLL